MTRWVYRLSPFDFHIDHIPAAKMVLVGFTSRQPNQKAAMTNKYDSDFAVATIFRILDAKQIYVQMIHSHSFTSIQLNSEASNTN